MGVISTKKVGDVLVVISDNPPVNALGHAVRAGLKDAILQAKADDGVKAVVIRGEGRTFFAGADITEFGKPPKDPQFAELIDLLETCPKPIVAAIHGTALGGGLEISLACHYRVAVPSAKLGLPEVKLGILPGAGGTQRLPRVVGVEAALNMIVFGDPISAKKAEASGLLDTLVGEASLEDDAVAFAREVAKKSSHPITSQRSDKVTGVSASVFDDIRKANARKLKGQDAPQACVEAVQAATTMPFAEGVAKERELFLKL
ncbi:MAG: enoyl-CoA hydratase-related protein, partial [Hyphomonadaceae bacterium]|nr:enoyl-CoA hydratase-related protein [Hyphomonadaceae bacterium]